MSGSKSSFNREAYDRWAASYDHESNSTVAADDFAFPRVWSHVRGKRVLEIGAGTGRHTRRLIEAENDVTAVEISQKMLELARQKTRGLPVELILGDFLAEPPMAGLRGRRFEAIVMSLVLEHLPELPAFFARVESSLESGGEFFLSEIHPKRIAGGSQANFMDPVTGEPVRLESFAHSEEAILAAAKGAGLTVTLNQDVVGDERLVAMNSEWEKHRGRPMVKILVFRKNA